MKRLSAILLVGALVFGTVGCTNMNKTQQGLLSGAAGGAILGAGLGALTGGSCLLYTSPSPRDTR